VKRRAKFWIGGLAAAAMVGVVAMLVVRPMVVVGPSMEPTLQPWELCVSLRVYHYRPQRGDIVTFRTADNPPLYFVKRVIGLPGETVAIRKGVVLINGRPLPEPYTTVNPAWEVPATVIPPGKVFVAGDNREGTMHMVVATRLVVSKIVWHGRWRK